jgi:hypothetical protein
MEHITSLHLSAQVLPECLSNSSSFPSNYFYAHENPTNSSFSYTVKFVTTQQHSWTHSSQAPSSSKSSPQKSTEHSCTTQSEFHKSCTGYWAHFLQFLQRTFHNRCNKTLTLATVHLFPFSLQIVNGTGKKNSQLTGKEMKNGNCKGIFK